MDKLLSVIVVCCILSPVFSKICISSCKGVSDGDYQSCRGCDVYAACSNQILYDNRPCPADLVWDDDLKRCEYTSNTCPEQSDPPRGCVSSCVGMQNGDYQSCIGCDVYVTCSNELMYDERPCPSDLVWDDNKKRCEYKSSTCPEQSGGTMGEEEEQVEEKSVKVCISSCKGVSDGDYQSCLGCDVYATCSNQILYDNRPCPANLVWDDEVKRCEFKSRTCPEQSDSPGNCVRSCDGMEDGDYQSCTGCDVYVTCSNENMYDKRHCPEDLVWDDNKKRCEYKSTTCPAHSDDAEDVEVQEAEEKSVEVCISSCNGVSDGDYQSCLGCDVYATCSNQILYDNRPCPADLVWDDEVKRCEYTSSTCQGQSDVPKICVSSCAGMQDGDYQSCTGCDVYVTCSNEDMYDERPCPSDLVWDDNEKRCEHTSTTCPGDEEEADEEQTEEAEETPAEETPSDVKKSALKRLLMELKELVKKETTCIASCEGLDNGDYQSCEGCDVYATCANGVLFDNRSCPGDLIWDDDKKACGYDSTTCVHSGGNGETEEGDDEEDEVEGGNEAGSDEEAEGEEGAAGNKEGEEEDAEGAEGVEEATEEAKKSALKKLLMQVKSVVEEKTKCITSCKGLANGDYQSCQGCDVYATCSNGILYDKRPCPANLVWDDGVKRCEYKSNTCKPDLPSCYTDLSCSSSNYKYKRCAVRNKKLLSASLTKQVSRSTCELGESFGIKAGALWVDDGCRGNFNVCACSKIRSVLCSSNGFKYKECNVRRADTVLEVKLRKQKSNAKCELGTSFGINGGSIWVDKGCRGWFSVCV